MHSGSDPATPYRPIVVGFVLLSVPLLVAALFLSDGGAGRWANAAGAVVMLVCALLLGRGGAR